MTSKIASKTGLNICNEQTEAQSSLSATTTIINFCSTLIQVAFLYPLKKDVLHHNYLYIVEIK